MAYIFNGKTPAVTETKGTSVVPTALTSAAAADAKKPNSFHAEYCTPKATYKVTLEVARHPEKAKSGVVLVKPTLTVIPTAENKATDVAPEVIFVIDRSGSMDGLPTEQAIRAAKGFIETLPDGSKVTIIAFDNQAKVFIKKGSKQEACVVLSPAAAAPNAIDKWGGRGTNIDAGIQEIDAETIESRHGAVVFLLTDGEISRGCPDDPAVIINKMEQTLGGRVRMICLGLGSQYSASVLNAFGKATGFPHVYLKDGLVIQKFLDEAHHYIKPRTEPVRVCLKVNGHYRLFEDVESAGIGFSQKWSFQTWEVPVDDLRGLGVDCNLSFEIGGDRFVVHSGFSGMPRLEPAMVIAHLVREMDRITNSSVLNRQEKIQQLQSLADGIPNRGTHFDKVREAILRIKTLLADNREREAQAAAAAIGADNFSNNAGKELDKLLVMQGLDIRPNVDMITLQDGRYRKISRDVRFEDTTSPIALLDGQHIITLNPEASEIKLQVETVQRKIAGHRHKPEEILSLILQHVADVFNNPNSEQKTVVADPEIQPSAITPKNPHNIYEWAELDSEVKDALDIIHCSDKQDEILKRRPNWKQEVLTKLYNMRYLSRIHPHALFPVLGRSGTTISVLPYSVPIEKCIAQKKVSSFEPAFLLAHLVGSLVQGSVLPPGIVNFFRAKAYNLTEQAFAVYQTTDGKHLYLLDATDREWLLCMDLREPGGPEAAIAAYKGKGLDGLLLDVFNHYGVSGHPALERISDETMARVPLKFMELNGAYDPFKDLRCCITARPMNDPVIVRSGRVYEKAMLTDWLASHGGMEPTGESVTEEPKPARGTLAATWKIIKALPLEQPDAKGTAAAMPRKTREQIFKECEARMSKSVPSEVSSAQTTRITTIELGYTAYPDDDAPDVHPELIDKTLDLLIKQLTLTADSKDEKASDARLLLEAAIRKGDTKAWAALRRMEIQIHLREFKNKLEAIESDIKRLRANASEESDTKGLPANVSDADKEEKKQRIAQHIQEMYEFAKNDGNPVFLRYLAWRQCKIYRNRGWEAADCTRLPPLTDAESEEAILNINFADAYNQSYWRSAQAKEPTKALFHAFMAIVANARDALAAEAYLRQVTQLRIEKFGAMSQRLAAQAKFYLSLLEPAENGISKFAEAIKKCDDLDGIYLWLRMQLKGYEDRRCANDIEKVMHGLKIAETITFNGKGLSRSTLSMFSKDPGGHSATFAKAIGASAPAPALVTVHSVGSGSFATDLNRVSSSTAVGIGRVESALSGSFDGGEFYRTQHPQPKALTGMTGRLFGSAEPPLAGRPGASYTVAPGKQATALAAIRARAKAAKAAAPAKVAAPPPTTHAPGKGARS